MIRCGRESPPQRSNSSTIQALDVTFRIVRLQHNDAVNILQRNDVAVYTQRKRLVAPGQLDQRKSGRHHLQYLLDKLLAAQRSHMLIIAVPEAKCERGRREGREVFSFRGRKVFSFQREKGFQFSVFSFQRGMESPPSEN